MSYFARVVILLAIGYALGIVAFWLQNQQMSEEEAINVPANAISTALLTAGVPMAIDFVNWLQPETLK